MFATKVSMNKVSTARPARASARVVCQAEMPRRSLLAAPALLAALVPAWEAAAEQEMVTMPVDTLSTFQRSTQRDAFKSRVVAVLKAGLKGSDSPYCIRLMVREASTYDVKTGKGGFDGSIFLCDAEANLPQNAPLKPIMDKLRKLKTEIDAHPDAAKTGPISYSDLMVASVQVSTRLSWREVKIARAQTPEKGAQIADAFGTGWPLTFGREDKADCSAVKPLPADNAPVSEIVEFFGALGNKGQSGPFPGKAPFWEKPAYLLWTQSAKDPAAEEARFAATGEPFASLKNKYDASRETVTRTDFEVDLIDTIEKLSKLGAKFNPDGYLYAEVGRKLRL